MRSLLSALFVLLFSATTAFGLPDQGDLEFELQDGSEARIYLTATDSQTGEVLPPEPNDVPVGTSMLTGTVDATRDGQSWTVTDIDFSGTDIVITISIFSVTISEITLTMPFVDIPDATETPVTVSELVGEDDGSILNFDALDVTCTGCTDFAGNFGYRVDEDDREELAIVGPLAMNLGSENDAITLGGTLSAGFLLDAGIGTPLPVWVEGELLLLQVPEPSLALLQAGALLPLGVLLRCRRRSVR